MNTIFICNYACVCVCTTCIWMLLEARVFGFPWRWSYRPPDVDDGKWNPGPLKEKYLLTTDIFLASDIVWIIWLIPKIISPKYFETWIVTLSLDIKSSGDTDFKNPCVGAREMAHWLRALAALAEGQILMSSIHSWWFTSSCNPNSRRLDALL